MKEMHYLMCIKCRRKFGPSEIIYRCECGSLLEVRYEEPDFKPRGKGVWRYRSLLPCRRKPVTLQEGSTPIYECRKLREELGVNLWVKHEGMNPSGSFKDRGMTVGVTRALELGMKKVACASTGNTSASLSLYASAAGIPCVALLPSRKVASGKLSQTLLHGAKVYSIRGNFDQALEAVQKISAEHDFYLLNSVNPYRLEGQKTIAYEIAEFLKELPERVILPVGNAGNISAVYKGFLELYELGVVSEIPKMTGIQAKGASPIVEAVKKRRREIKPVKNPETLATAIRIGNPVNYPKAISAIYESGGTAEAVSDREIVSAQLDLARKEGIGVEPASAASLAGLRKLREEGKIERGERIVCILTGHLLKDPEGAIKVSEPPVDVKKIMELKKFL